MTLYELNQIVRSNIELTLPELYWVEAELSECRESGGHCYMDLIQKENESIVARAQARCWRYNWSLLRPKFERATGQQLHAGMKVMLRVKAQFHEAYGFSWIVQDINPNYTIGDQVRQRQEIIRTLKAEGVFDLNRSLTIPMFAQRIAVISSASAAGYGDFCNQLLDNPYGFTFTTQLFPAIMQGEQVEETIIAALDKINDSIGDFDVVVIIRGGGGTADLTGFDTLNLAENVANFPLPIITGIGHDRDESVLDMISCVRVKTPTAAADFLVANLAQTADRIETAGKRITDIVRMRMEAEKLRMERLSNRIPAVVNQKCSQEQLRLSRITQQIPMLIKVLLTKEKHNIDLLEQRCKALDPINTLRRGYAIVLHNGKAVKSPKDVTPGESVSLMLAEGVIEAKIK